MRVLMISKALVTGVYQKKLEELATMSGMELLAVVPPYWIEGRVGRVPLDRMFTHGYELAVEEMRFNGHHHTHFYPGLAAHMRRFRPDIVHIDEEPFNFVAAQATWLARSVGARTLFFTWQNLDRRYPPPFSLFERYCYKVAAAALAGNEDAATVLRRKGFTKRIDVISQFGVDPDIFQPLGPPVGERGEFTVGYYGRLVPEKGVDTLIEAAALLRNRPRLVILGSGESLDALKQLARGRGIGETTEFRGTIGSHEIPYMLAGFDVVVVPSRSRPNWKEQFGRVIVEAMACQVPVIGSDSGEIPNVIGDAGLVFPEGDAQALAGQLRRIMDDRSLLRRLSTAGRERVLERYTQRQVAERTYQMYSDLIHTRPGGGSG